MRRLLAVLVTVLGVGSLAMGQATTMPAVDQGVKLQEPVKVLVIPFSQIGDNGHAWVGAAIHENLVTQASADSAVQVIAMNQPMQNNSQQDAVNTAKGVGAGFVVFGSFQFSGDELRVNGRVMETTYGQTVATLTATGPIIDLFKIEDTLSGQMSGGLPQPVNNLPTVSYGPQQNPEVDTGQAQQQVPYYVANPQDNSAGSSQAPTYVYAPTYSYPTYPAYSNPYPYYSYPYYPYWGWGWGGGVVIINGRVCRPGWGGGVHTWGSGVHTWNSGFHGGFNSGFNGGFHAGGVTSFHGGGMGGFHGGMGGMGGMHGGFAGGGGGFGGGHGR
jgi:TolB-like protein